MREAGKIYMPFKIGEWTKTVRVCYRKFGLIQRHPIHQDRMDLHMNFQGEKKTKKEGNFWLFKALKLKLCFLRGRGAIFLAEKWLAKSTKGAPDVPSEVNSGPQRERAQKTNNGPRLGQEAFSYKIMKMHLDGLVSRL